MKKIFFAVFIILVLVILTIGYLIFFRPVSVELPEESHMSLSTGLETPSPTPSGIASSPIETESGSFLQEVAHDPEADAFIASLGKMGEDYTLHSQEFEQGDLVDETIHSLGWNGDMILRINSATVTNYAVDSFWAPDAQEHRWEAEAQMMREPMILTLDLSLTNKDARKPYGVQYDFNVCMFRLAGYRDMLPESKKIPEYVSIASEYTGSETVFSNPGEGRKYYSFELPEGETMDFTMKYLVDHEYLSVDTPFLAISPGRVPDAGILLDNIQEE